MFRFVTRDQVRYKYGILIGPGHGPPSCGVKYARADAAKPMHRLGFACVKPKSLPRTADREGRGKFVRDYGGRMNRLLPDEAIVFVDAVHPECQSRPAHGWFIRTEKPAIRSKTGRRRLNPHVAFDPGKCKFTMAGGERATADTTLRRLRKLERAWPRHQVIHVYLDNVRHHHARKPNRSRHGRTAASGRISRRPTPSI